MPYYDTHPAHDAKGVDISRLAGVPAVEDLHDSQHEQERVSSGCQANVIPPGKARTD
jgi:hypothetical protein